MPGRDQADVPPPRQSAATDYVLTAAGREEAEHARLEHLQELFDPQSQRRLARVQPGWRCLDVGAGRGSIALWLSRRVGTSGEVVATDIDISGLKHLGAARCEVLTHNILSDPLAPLRPGSFDLIFARLVLVHLPGQQEPAVRRMIECLRPGGWLLIEDIDMTTLSSTDPRHPLSADFDRILQAMRDGYRARQLLDITCGRALGAVLRRSGLFNVEQEVSAKIHAGASPMARWHAQSMRAIVDNLVKRGVPEDARRAAIAASALLVKALEDPDFSFLDQLHHAAWGQRAVSD
jgi:SAM-dependent methyltransferase